MKQKKRAEMVRAARKGIKAMRGKSKKAIPAKPGSSTAGEVDGLREEAGSHDRLERLELPRNLFQSVEDLAAYDEAFSRLKEVMEPERLQAEIEKAFDAVTIPPDELKALCQFASDFYRRFVVALYWAGYLRAVREDVTIVKELGKQVIEEKERQEKEGKAGHDKDVGATRE